MNTPARLALGLLLTCGLFVVLTGCGGTKPESSKAEEKNKSGHHADGQGQSKNNGPPRKIDLESGVGKDAVAFLKALGAGAATADKLSAGFVKMIGLPVELPADKARGYSSSAAESWMKQVGAGATFGLPAGFAGADAAVLWGGFQGPGRKGDYALRLINEGGAWKVDSFALTSASFNGSAGSGGGADGEYQRFAARAFGGLLCDKSGMPKDCRVLALAACLTPALRDKLAEPFGSDKGQGFDYNRGKLLLEAEKMGGGAESYATIQQGETSDFRLDVTKTGGARPSTF